MTDEKASCRRELFFQLEYFKFHVCWPMPSPWNLIPSETVRGKLVEGEEYDRCRSHELYVVLL
jgi:hypothetical protein